MYKIFFFILLFILIIIIIKDLLYTWNFYYAIDNKIYQTKLTKIDKPEVFDFSSFENICLISLYLIDTIYDDQYASDEFLLLKKITYGKTHLGSFLLLEKKQMVFVVFRGTVKFSEFLNFDSRTHQTIYHHGGNVEKGFNKLYQLIQDEILNFDFGEKQIVFTGHSLGGAMALLGGVDIMMKNKKVDIYLFGCPHIFNKNAVTIINEKSKQTKSQIYRIQNSCDIIPIFPLPITISFHLNFYEPIGRLTEFTDNRYSYLQNHSIYTYFENLAKDYRRRR